MPTPAADLWREQLEGWALPRELLEALPESPYGSPPVLWRRRTRRAEGPGGGRTGEVLAELVPRGGSLLDVGAGIGRLSLPLAAAGHPVTALEANPAMAEGFRAEAHELGVEVRPIEGRWPELAGDIDPHDVVLCANVVYDVPDLGPFLTELHRHGRIGVVVELTTSHPWSHLAPYYRALHDLDRPSGPTDGLFAQAVREILGVDPHLERWRRRGVHRFSDLQELLAYYGRRLRVVPERAGELHDVLAPDIHEEEGWLVVGDPERETVTMWWPGGAA